MSALFLVVFSAAAVAAERRSFHRIELALSDPVERPRLTALLTQRISSFERDFIERLLVFDIFLLLVAAAGSWFLSGRTIQPIEQMVREQEEFAADVSHELRTPLSTIAITIEALRRTTRDLPDSLLSVLASITEETSRMTRIVEGLLTLVRPIRTGVARGTCDLGIIARTAVARFRLLARRQHIRLTLRAGVPVLVSGDRDQLLQAMTILIDNALKFTPAGGAVDVSTGRRKQWATISVSDTASGISAVDLPRIFDRFYRSRVSGVSIGTGLGLAIAKKLVLSHGGRISVSSTSGSGSTFSISLPVVS